MVVCKTGGDRPIVGWQWKPGAEPARYEVEIENDVITMFLGGGDVIVLTRETTADDVDPRLVPIYGESVS